MPPAARSRLSVDGGISRRRPRRRVIAAGADTLVAGTAVFGAPDYAAAIAALRGEGPRRMSAHATRGAGCAMRAARSRGCRACAWAACRMRPRCRCAIPGRAILAAARGCCGRAGIGGGVRALQPGGWGEASGSVRAATPRRTASPGCATCARSAPMRPGCAPARWWPTGSTRRPADAAGAPSGRGRRADRRLARPLRFLRRLRRRCVPPAADGAAGVRCAQPVGGAARRGTGRAGADRAEGADRRGRRAAGARRLPDPRAALPAAGDRPAGAAGRLPRRAQPRRAACRVAGPDRDPRPAAGRAGAAAAGARPARSSGWRRRCG